MIPSIAFPLQGEGFLPISQPGTVYYSPFPDDLFSGAWVIGLVTWITLRSLLPYQNPRLAALWILGVWLSVGLGIITMFIWRSSVPLFANVDRTFDAALAYDRVKIGLVSGLVTGLLLLFVIDQAGRAQSVTKSLAQPN